MLAWRCSLLYVTFALQIGCIGSLSRKSKNSQENATSQSDQRPSYILAALAPITPCALNERAILSLSLSGRVLERRWSAETGWNWVQHGSFAEPVLAIKCSAGHSVVVLTEKAAYVRAVDLELKHHIPCLQANAPPLQMLLW